MRIIVKQDYEEMSRFGAELIGGQLRMQPDSVLGLATGGTPLGIYTELIRMHHEAGLDFSKVTTFNLDEYVGLPPEHEQSYAWFMNEHLFRHINVSERFVHVPNGMHTFDDIPTYCQWYEEAIERAGGLDIQLLGIGANGHIAFNEPSSSLGSRTRIKTLSKQTRDDNARFFGSEEDVPKYAITMGIGTIMEAREIILAASGEAKAEAIRETIEGPITQMVPASAMQMHRNVILLLDEAAASRLTKVPLIER
jgi:glucosamine-6-phosphate deaminase